jgi:TM2 domain-containing membrane protein YozV
VRRSCTATTSLRLVLRLFLGVCLSIAHASASSLTPVSPPTRAADAEPPLFAFARSLFDSGEYYRAIGEFQRFLFFQAEHPLVSQAQLTIGLAFFCGERWLPAFEVFRRVALANPDSSIGREAALWMAEARARGGDHPAAIRLYQEVMRQSPASGISQRAAYLTGWSQLYQRQWIEAREAFVRVDPKSPYHASAQRLATALDPPPELPQRSPTLARIFSTALPGAGQIYAGRTLDGLIGLGLHAALIAGTTGAIWAGLEGAAGIGAFFTWGFYQTQMSNAANSARDFNAQAADRFIGQLAAQERLLLHAYARPIPCAP